ncbi:MAG: tRNA dihydrouridine synthase DusB [Spirochaetaceae bacterium]|jgi:nifR3 family TIM-barrel protein|nr:tRNA dihydrouridine synthase DusB [Spirochaetaceae bacterium]
MSLYHPVGIGSLELPGNLFLAPIAGYTDRAFRSLCVEQGADFTCTELISAEALVRKGVNTSPLIRRADRETRYAVQLFGADPQTLYQAAALLSPYHPDVVDLNCGCPVPKVVKTGSGSALMRQPALLGRLVEALVRSSGKHLGSVPVTVKMRSGWDTSSINYALCARIAVESGAALVSLHPRTRAQGYGGKSNWGHIQDLVSRLSIPVAGSGDLFSPEDAKAMFHETRCAAVLFARGALGNPFIFSATRSLLRTGSYTPTPEAERLRTGLRHLRLLARDWGEPIACREMRKHFCAYTKGIPGGAPLRNKFVHAETIEEYAALCAAAEVAQE